MYTTWTRRVCTIGCCLTGGVLPSNRPQKAKTRISLALTTNADGTDKLKPLVIGHAKKLRCFLHFRPDLYVDYFANKKAWMMAVIFSEWLLQFDQRMTRENRNVLLLLNNASSHIPPSSDQGQSTLTNVKVHFLSPTTTSHLQPMDGGIIKAFKAHYSRWQIRHLIDAYDAGRTPHLQLNEAIHFLKMA